MVWSDKSSKDFEEIRGAIKGFAYDIAPRVLQQNALEILDYLIELVTNGVDIPKPVIGFDETSIVLEWFYVDEMRYLSIANEESELVIFMMEGDESFSDRIPLSRFNLEKTMKHFFKENNNEI